MREKTVNSESPSNLAGQRAKLGVEDELRKQKETDSSSLEVGLEVALKDEWGFIWCAELVFQP